MLMAEHQTMIRCPACGTGNIDGSTICKKCRALLPAQGAEPPAVPPPEKKSAKDLVEELKALEVVGPETDTVVRGLVDILLQADIPVLVERYPARQVSDLQKFLAEMVEEKLEELERHQGAPAKDSLLLLYLGSAAYLVGDYGRALERFSAAAELDRTDAVAEYDRGMALQSLSRYDEAITSFTRAITLRPEFEQAWANKARTFVLQGKGRDALEYFERALCLDRGDPEAWFGKGATEEEMGQYEEALRCLDTAIRLRPDFVQAWNYKGDALFHLGRLDEALEAYGGALELKPHDFEAWNNLGIAFFAKKELDRALEAFNKALMVRAESDDAWLNKGTVLELKGEMQEALACYDRALRLNPDCEQARKAREKLYSIGMTSNP